MKNTIKFLSMTAALALALSGCRTIEEAATANAVAVCTEGGYGPASQYYDYCVDSLKPVAIQLEQQRRQERISESLAMIAQGLNTSSAPKVTCVQTGAVTRCY